MITIKRGRKESKYNQLKEIRGFHLSDNLNIEKKIIYIRYDIYRGIRHESDQNNSIPNSKQINFKKNSKELGNCTPNKCPYKE